MTSDTMGILEALVQRGLPPAGRRSRPWSFPFVVTRRALWLGVSAALAIAVSGSWLLWIAHLSGVDVVSTLRQGFAFALMPLLGLGGMALVSSGPSRAAAAAVGEPFDNFGDVTFTLDRSFALRSVSPAFGSMFGLPARAVIGRRALRLIHPADRAAVSQLLAAMLAGQERAESVHRCRHARGQWLWIATDLRLVRQAGTGRPQAILGMARDVTRWKNAEIRLETANRRLASLALEDGLTGLGNRRRFDEALAQEYRRAVRSGTPLSLLMIDADKFKQFNDTHGHQSGDICLRVIARMVQSAAQRPGDIAARYGGEEFVVLLPSTNLPGALVIAERIRQAVEGAPIIVQAGAQTSVTVSIGAASVVPRLEESSSIALVRQADLALYVAKRDGRNRVCPVVKEARRTTLQLVRAAS